MWDQSTVIEQLRLLNDKLSAANSKLDSLIENQSSTSILLSNWYQSCKDWFADVDFNRIVLAVSLIAFVVFVDRFIRRGWLNG